ncbi:hypothetical protein FACS189427_00220 [Planctomycetales bacterium]|nr:hypothetical protein FACS189427_00220 [Planctomycetales bacterium]
MNLIARRFVIISVLPLCAFFCAAFACAQNSHIQDLIQQYKAQNPAVAEALQQKEQQRQQQPEIKVAAIIPAAAIPAAGNSAEVNPEINPNQYRQLTTGSAPLPLFGNPLDPLNSRYDAQWNSVPNQRATPYDELLNDASLNDVFFINSKTGWAVGNHGVIWKTSDGGQNWQLQRSPAACTLYAVHFTDEQSGFAVGGYHFPYTNQGRGIILTTNNGGEHWAQVPLPNVPVLRCIKMSDPTKGIAAGESSELFPSGIFTTRDGGRTWHYVDGEKTEGWAALDFIDGKSGFGIGCFGSVQNFGQMKSATQSSALPVPNSVRFSQVKTVPVKAGQPNAVQAYLVGDNYILSTSDNGAKWGSVVSRLPGSVASVIDLKTVETIGNDIWAAGNPGCCIYHSADAGKTWKAVQTNQSVPVKKIVFTDAKNGWAIGELGTILATKDGGNTWQKQRTGGSRFAVLGIFGTPDDVPLETFIQLCANQGYLGGAVLLFRQPDGSRNRSFGEPQYSVIDTLNEGFIRTGANVLWELNRVPLLRPELQTDSAQLDAYIKKQNDGKELEKIREMLVLTIRQRQPDILLASNTDQTAGGNTSAKYSVKSPIQEFVLREIVQAVKSAADPTAYPYQITELGLKPWQVKKIHLALPKGTVGDVNIPLTEPLVRLGQPIDELAEISYGLFETVKCAADNVQKNKERQTILGYSTQLDILPPNPNKDFFAGLDIQPGSDCRRAFAGNYADSWERIQQRIQQRRQVLGIIEQTADTAKKSGSSASDVRLASNAEELTRKIDNDAAVQVLLKMSRYFSQSGDWESAVEANELLVRQYALHPLARYACLFLVPHFGSDESHWSTTGKGDTNALPVVPTLEKTVMVEQFLERNFADIAEEPPLRFAAAAAARRLGWLNYALTYYQKRGNKKYDDIWSMRARAEYWAAVQNKAELLPELRDCPLPTLFCPFSQDKPYLDGQFDRQFDNGTWFKSNLYSFTPVKQRSRLQEIFREQSAAAGIKRENKLRSESANFGTQTMLMYDKEYLYIGFRCKKAVGFNYPPFSEKPRSRDTDLSQQDRVEILIDTDRDYSTYYTLTIDSRGWASDSCRSSSYWNPEYYIARNEDDNYWYLETAIPLNSLTGQIPAAGTVWGIGFRRIVPGIGIECWNAENSFGLTEGFGFLMFE